MTRQNGQPEPAAEWRRQAEAIARKEAAPLSEDLASRSPEGIRQTLHELRVHQLELEMQNEELRRAQAELDAARARYFDLYDLAPVGYCTLSEQGLILAANLTAATLLGVARGALVQQPISRFIFPEDQDSYYRFRKQLWVTGALQAGEFRMLRAAAAPFWARLEAIAAPDAAGAPGCRVVMSDITARKQAEEVLRASEERHRTVLQTAMDGFWLADTAGRLLEVNETYCRMSGYSAQELLAMRIADLETVETADVVAAHIQKIMAEGEDRFESRHRRQNGSIFDVEVSVQYQPVEGGRLVIFLRDITDRNRAVAEREQLQAQLIQAQKMESVGRLAGGVAHDFNNMLAVILGYVEMALEQMDPAHPLHASLEEIRSCAQRSADLTRQLLAFARQQTVAPKVLDLNETVAGMVKMLERLIGEDIQLIWQPKAELWPVKVDPSQIDQIVANLCVNARDAIAGTGKVTIETGTTAFDEAYCAHHAGFAPGEYVWLAVSDDGCGMDQETLAHVFEPFFTTKGVGEGTGLGLATVYGTVKQNNGFITVYSEPGQGTMFTIYLPRHVAKAGRARTAGAAGPAMRGRETILLVEDEPMILTMCKMMLESYGYRVLAAGTPGAAIRLAEEHAGEIHLLMTDVVMPEMNGRELAKRLLSCYPNLKRLFMSGYTANVIACQGVLDEGVQFIQKPFSIKGLAAKVREVLDSGVEDQWNRNRR